MTAAALAMEQPEAPAAGQPDTLAVLRQHISEDPELQDVAVNALILSLHRATPQTRAENGLPEEAGILTVWGVRKAPAEPICGPQLAVGDVRDAKRFFAAQGFQQHARRRDDEQNLICAWVIE